ncbi:MAG: hypothetical protein ACYDDE_03925 [bacterium]
MSKSEILQFIKNNQNLQCEINVVKKILKNSCLTYQHCFANSLKNDGINKVIYKSKYFFEYKGLVMSFFVYERVIGATPFVWKIKSQPKIRSFDLEL